MLKRRCWRTVVVFSVWHDLTATDAFEATFSATAEHVEATAKTGESIHLGMVAVLAPLLPEEGWTRFADEVVGAVW